MGAASHIVRDVRQRSHAWRRVKDRVSAEEAEVDQLRCEAFTSGGTGKLDDGIGDARRYAEVHSRR